MKTIKNTIKLKIILILGSALFITLHVHAQPIVLFQNFYTYGNYIDNSVGLGFWIDNSVEETDDGGFIVVGHTDPTEDVYLLKANSNGTVAWSATYGYAMDIEVGHTVSETFDNMGNPSGFIIAGSSGQNGGDLLLIKTDPVGGLQWSYHYGQSSRAERAYSVRQTTDGGYIAAGSSILGSNGKIYVVKTNPNGTRQWAFEYSAPIGYDAQIATSVIEPSTSTAANPEYIVAGNMFPSGLTNIEDVFVMSLDRNGAINWFNVYNRN
ncbi:MAG: hypothetical protein IIA45_07475, partial [Bacteroidetes bacterium]|nr:hypothetical protein [Bacteroidota bacterium]